MNSKGSTKIQWAVNRHQIPSAYSCETPETLHIGGYKGDITHVATSETETTLRGHHGNVPGKCLLLSDSSSTSSLLAGVSFTRSFLMGLNHFSTHFIFLFIRLLWV